MQLLQALRPAFAALFVVVSAGCVSGDGAGSVMNRAIEALANDPDAYSIDIQAAGLASLDEVRRTDDGFELDYSYSATDGSGEDRSGTMTLLAADSASGDSNAGDSQAAGQWRTVATNGTVYSGDLRFDFARDGTATGSYDFGESTFAITINRP